MMTMMKLYHIFDLFTRCRVSTVLCLQGSVQPQIVLADADEMEVPALTPEALAEEPRSVSFQEEDEDDDDWDDDDDDD